MEWQRLQFIGKLTEEAVEGEQTKRIILAVTCPLHNTFWRLWFKTYVSVKGWVPVGLLVGMGWKCKTSGHQCCCCLVRSGCVVLCRGVLGCIVLPCPLHNTSRGFNLKLCVRQSMSIGGASGLEVGDGWLSSLLLFGGAMLCCLVLGSVVAVAQNIICHYLKNCLWKKGSLSVWISLKHKIRGMGFYSPSLMWCATPTKVNHNITSPLFKVTHWSSH